MKLKKSTSYSYFKGPLQNNKPRPSIIPAGTWHLCNITSMSIKHHDVASIQIWCCLDIMCSLWGKPCHEYFLMLMVHSNQIAYLHKLLSVLMIKFRNWHPFKYLYQSPFQRYFWNNITLLANSANLDHEGSLIWVYTVCKCIHFQVQLNVQMQADLTSIEFWPF